MRLELPTWVEWKNTISNLISTAILKAGIQGYRGLTGEDDALRITMVDDTTPMNKMPFVRITLASKSWDAEGGTQQKPFDRSYTKRGSNIIEKVKPFIERLYFDIVVYDNQSDRSINILQAISAYFLSNGEIELEKNDQSYRSQYILDNFVSSRQEDNEGNIVWFRHEASLELTIDSSPIKRDRVLKAVSDISVSLDSTITEIDEDEETLTINL